MIQRIRQILRFRLPDALQQSAIYGLAVALPKGISFLMVPVFTAFLVPLDYGRLDILQTLANLLTIVAAMGMAEMLFRFAGEADGPDAADEIAADVAGLAVISALVVTLITQIAAPIIASWLPGGVTELQTRLMLGAIGLTACILVPVSWMRMQGHAAMFLAVNVSWVGTQAILSAILLWTGHGVTGVMVACLIAHILAAGGLLFWIARTVGIRLNPRRWRVLIVFGAPLILVGMAGFVLGSLDRWILADAVSTEHMAVYALAAKFGIATVMLIQPFDMWWLPKRFQVLKQPDGEEQSARMIAFGVTWTAFAAMTMAVLGPFVIVWMTPDSYHGAVAYVPWLAALAALHASSGHLNVGCHTGKSTSVLALIDGAAAAVAFAGYILWIPDLGAMGAIHATAIALTLRLAATIYASQVRKHLPLPLVRLAVMAATSFAGIYWLTGTGTGLDRFAVGSVCLLAIMAVAVVLRLVPVLSPRGPEISKVEA